MEEREKIVNDSGGKKTDAMEERQEEAMHE